MAYIAFDLDALKRVPDVARQAHMPEAAVGYGLVRVWSHCWSEKTDRIPVDQLDGFFDGATPRLAKALELFRFVESDGETLRVRGADRYLRIEEGRRKGGQAAKSNLVPGAKQKRNLSAAAEKKPRRSREVVSAPVSADSGAFTEQRAASTDVSSPSETSAGAPTVAGSQLPGLVRDVVAEAERAGHTLAYGLNGKAYSAVLSDLLKFYAPAEIRRRWGIGLRLKYPTVRTPLDLRKFWDHCATDEPAKKNGAPLPPSDFSRYDPNDPADNPF